MQNGLSRNFKLKIEETTGAEKDRVQQVQTYVHKLEDHEFPDFLENQ